MADPLAVPSRIAFAGDWHMNTRWAVSAVERAAHGHADVLIQLGDFGYTFDPGFLFPLDQILQAAGLPLLFVDGNHESFPTLRWYPVQPNGLRRITDHIWHLPRGFRWKWGGIRFLACGGAYSVDRPWRVPGASWWPEETITEADVAGCVEGGPADVLIAHDCPAGVTIPGVDDRTMPAPFPAAELVSADQHRQMLRRIVDAVQPRQVWHGHYHVEYDAKADFEYGQVRVTGLDCDETRMDRNLRLVYLADLAGRGEGRG